MYKLKVNQPDIEIMDGPFTGRHYRSGETYTEIPPEESYRFEPVCADPNPTDPIDPTDPITGGEL